VLQCHHSQTSNQRHVGYVMAIPPVDPCYRLAGKHHERHLIMNIILVNTSRLRCLVPDLSRNPILLRPTSWRDGKPWSDLQNPNNHPAVGSPTSNPAFRLNSSSTGVESYLSWSLLWLNLYSSVRGCPDLLVRYPSFV